MLQEISEIAVQTKGVNQTLQQKHKVRLIYSDILKVLQDQRMPHTHPPPFNRHPPLNSGFLSLFILVLWMSNVQTYHVVALDRGHFLIH